MGTPDKLVPIAEQVLAWVAHERNRWRRTYAGTSYIPQDKLDDLRRIELCALATREAAMFHALYGASPAEPAGHIDHVGGDPHGKDWL